MTTRCQWSSRTLLWRASEAGKHYFLQRKSLWSQDKRAWAPSSHWQSLQSSGNNFMVLPQVCFLTPATCACVISILGKWEAKVEIIFHMKMNVIEQQLNYLQEWVWIKLLLQKSLDPWFDSCLLVQLFGILLIFTALKYSVHWFLLQVAAKGLSMIKFLKIGWDLDAHMLHLALCTG